MLIHIRTRINDAHIAMTDDVNPSACKRERTWIFGNYATDKRADLLNDAILKLNIADKRNSDSH